MKTPTLSAIEQTVFTLANEQYEILLNTIRSPEYQALEHGDVEQFVHQEGTELLRRLFQGHLDLRAANEVQYQNLVGSDRQTRPHHRQNTHRQLETLFGEVVVTRVGYSTKTPGVSALYPADGILNLATDRYSDGLRRRVAQEASKVSFSETVTTIAETTGAQVGKRQCEEITVKVAQDFNEFYAQRTQECPETTTDLLVLTTDGKGIVMHQEDLREATAKAASRAQQTRKVRLSPGQKRQRKRMATVASVYSTPRFVRQPEQIIGTDIDKPERPAISNKRVWASVRDDSVEVINSAFEEATRRDPQHQREWVVLVDGSLQQLEAIKAAAKNNLVSVSIVLDFIHVLEYLWKAAHCFFTPGAKEAEPWVMARAFRLLQGKVSDVAAGIRRSATLQKLSESARENADKCADYLLKYRKHLQYDQFLSKGYPALLN